MLRAGSGGIQAGLFSAVSSLGIHHRCPIKARTGSERYDRHLHADPNPRHEQFTLPRRGPRLHHLDRTPSRGFHCPVVLYASLATSLSVAFLTMLGEQ